jgi:uncharacterized membrane protein
MIGMAKIWLLLTLLNGWFSPAWQSVTPPPPSEAVVRAVLFYSPTCGHCQHVIKEVLPPIFETYGQKLQIIGVDVSSQSGQTLYLAALNHYRIDKQYVPVLVVGSEALIGSAEIPERFPGLIDQYLRQGGVEWPAVPGLVEAITAAQTAQAPTPAPTDLPPTATLSATETAASLTLATSAAAPPAAANPAHTPTSPPTPLPSPTAGAPISVASPTVPGLILTSEHDSSIWGRFSRDLTGGTLAVFILLGMLAALFGAAFYFLRPAHSPSRSTGGAAILLLCLIGIGVAGYLAYVEAFQVTAVCGPVGDCNAVQSSSYARLFGLIPIGLLGLVGYLLIILAWVVGKTADQPLASYAWLALFGMTAFGLLFSLYLTFLEPFVIGAVCAWCLSSAVIMTLLFWLSLAPARLALSRLRRAAPGASADFI